MGNKKISEFQRIRITEIEKEITLENLATVDAAGNIKKLKFSGNFGLPPLSEGKIWLGDSNGDAQESDVPTISRTIDLVTATSYLIVPADKTKIKRFTSNTTTLNVTVDSDSLDTPGDEVHLDHWGTGDLLVVAGTATIRVNVKRLLYSDGQYSRITVQKMTSTEYRVFGELDIA